MVAVKKMFEVQAHRRDAEGERADAGPSVFLSRELEYILAETYRAQIPPLKLFNVIPVRTDVDPRAPNIVYTYLTQVGAAALIRSPGVEIPRVDIYRERFTSPVKEIADMYGYSVVELENAEFAGVPLEGELGLTARRAIAEKAVYIALNGDTATRLPGLLINPNIPRSTVAAGLGGSTWALKTADEILIDMNALANNMVSNTKDTHEPDTMALPIEQFNLVATKPRAVQSDETVLSYFKRTNPYIKTVVQLRELDGAGTGGVDAAIAFKNDKSVFAYYMVMAFEQRPQQERNLEIQVICREKTGGTIVQQPLGLAILEGI